MKKQVIKLLVRCVLAFAALFAFNIAGGGLGLSVGLNVLNAGIVGLLGISGFALLLVLQYMSR